MKSAKLFISILSATLTFSSIAYSQQSKIDSLLNVLKTEKEDTNRVNTLNKLASLFDHTSRFRQADSITYKALDLSLKLNFQIGIANSYRNIGTICYTQHKDTDAMKYYLLAFKTDETSGNKSSLGVDYTYIGLVNMHQGNYNEALKNDSIGLKIEELTNNKQGISLTYQFMGIIYRKKGNNPEALKDYLQSLKMAEEMGDRYTAGSDYMDVGNLYQDQVNSSEALKYYALALKALEEINDRRGMENAYINIGNVYTSKQDYTQALSYLTKSLELATALGDRSGMAFAFGNLGDVYENLGNHEKALENQYLSFKIDQELGDKESMVYDYVEIGNVLFAQRKYKDAAINYDKGQRLAQQLGSIELISTTYHAKAGTDTAMSNFKAAYNDYIQFIKYRDSLTNEKNTKKILSEKMTFEFDKKQAIEKAEQDKKDAITLVDKKRQEFTIIAVSIGLLLVMLFSGLLFSRFRLTQKQKKIIERQKGLVEEKQKEILDSITYAKRLQDAILPPLSTIKKCFPESFVLYKPKDIVAGDFYWMESIEGTNGPATLIAACDCTGHGVPGAMVSVVCSNALNRAIKEFKITETGKILDKVRELVLETFEKSESEVKDGMDISLCSISFSQEEKKGYTMQWSGAYNPLWIVKNSPSLILPIREEESKAPLMGGDRGAFVEIAPDKQPIGKQDNSKSFSTHTLKLEKGDAF